MDQRLVRMVSGEASLVGDLTIPPRPRAIVLFAHGSGSSRHSRRDQTVANALVDVGLATLLFDLLTDRESTIDAQTAALRFDVDLLSERVVSAIDWIRSHAPVADLPLALSGASTGAAAAFVAAAARSEHVDAIVSRSGRLGLAGPSLERVSAPVLLIVGGEDPTVVRDNQHARAHLGGGSALVLVRGATHLFEEPGALDEVARVTAGWLERRYATR
jgi:pimeloyl-ACP methyl ester carboxylesterase